MYKKTLDKFFKENDSNRDKSILTAAGFAHFQIKLSLSPEANESVQDLIDEIIFMEQPKREKDVLVEKSEIEIATIEQIIRYMRCEVDSLNYNVLVKRAIIFEDELIPEIIKRLKTSLNTGFIEKATRVLSSCKKDIAEELIEHYDDIRNPYTQSMVLLVLGFKGNETHIPWLIERYFDMKRQYPKESYFDGAYYALSEIDGRFYSV